MYDFDCKDCVYYGSCGMSLTACRYHEGGRETKAHQIERLQEDLREKERELEELRLRDR